MITVDGEHEFPEATRYSTDEHNNLEIWAGTEGDRLIALFAKGGWERVEVQVED